jgi:hypothetical protein
MAVAEPGDRIWMAAASASGLRSIPWGRLLMVRAPTKGGTAAPGNTTRWSNTCLTRARSGKPEYGRYHVRQLSRLHHFQRRPFNLAR